MDKKMQILFVDDESNILNGLRRMLRSMRREWEMTFALGGQEAMDYLATCPFDVIVSDMRMTGMDGVQLLNKVKQHYPHMVRIALSGQTSKKEILESVGPIHQYIAKPCDAETLRQTIKHVCGCRNLLTNEKLQGLISHLESLPSLSSNYVDLVEELQSEDASMAKIGDIMSHDVSMTVKILQLINSSFFGMRQHVTDIRQAVTLLGLDIIKALVMATKIFDQFKSTKVEEFSLGSLWQHSISVGERARIIARQENGGSEISDLALLCGMLHDIGKLVLITAIPEEYREVLSHQQKGNISVSEAEKDIIGATHAEVGAYLLGLWGFSNSFIEALTFHHRPREAGGTTLNLLTVVHVANIFTHKLEADDTLDNDRFSVDIEYVEQLDLANRLPVWWDSCREKSAAFCQS